MNVLLDMNIGYRITMNLPHFVFLNFYVWLNGTSSVIVPVSRFGTSVSLVIGPTLATGILEFFS